ncbi:Hypothetical protein POVN_LOCUS109 [uncultured virus]|nr:Hypothetical protein POVN_LOCUS109 [uncultured virus]
MAELALVFALDVLIPAHGKSRHTGDIAAAQKPLPVIRFSAPPAEVKLQQVSLSPPSAKRVQQAPLPSEEQLLQDLLDAVDWIEVFGLMGL